MCIINHIKRQSRCCVTSPTTQNIHVFGIILHTVRSGHKCSGWGLMLCLQVSRSAQDHEDITNALFYSILTDPATAPKVNTHI